MKTFYAHTLRIISLALVFVVTGIFSSQATKHIVTVANFVFTPSSMTINAGDTVVWTWSSGSHTTTSTTIPAGAAAWSNAIDAAHLSFSYVPTVLGTYNYKCNIHPTTMLASFTVVCPAAPSLTISAGGATTFCTGSTVALSKTSVGTFATLQWKLNGSNIAGATTVTFNADATGSYTLAGTNSCGNSSTSNAISVTVNKKPKANITPAGPLNICASQPVLLTVSSANNQTYQWKKGSANISGATGTTLLVTATGDYKCKVTKTSTGCNKTSKAVSVTVNPNCKIEVPAVTATAFPNPTQDYFVVNTSSLSLQNGIIKVYDLTGKMLETYTVINENTAIGNNLTSGVYFAKIESGGKLVQVLKLMKN
ncbi:MAG: T9SS type A sorting domain-containing protein [Chitinophagaceae bacterium]|nr:T9SS type A sorting domain-containing protein [Chitinophagaceae bacterium]